MTGYILRRVVLMLLVMLIVSSTVFVIIRLAPGDPATVMLGDLATEADVERLREALGLDMPLITQFGIFLRNVATGDLGTSIVFTRPVLSIIGDRAELTLTLTFLAIVIAIAIGVPLGILSATKHGTLADQSLTTGAMFAASLPSFWVGLTLITFFSVDLHWFPVAGYGPPDATFPERLHHLVLPAIALGLPNSALIMRFTRNGMLEVLSEDYIRTARAKGMPMTLVIWKHALKNALNQILTVVGLTVAILLGGAVVTESVFALPGVGRLVVQSVLNRDYPIIQGTLLVVSGVYVLINLIIDILYAVIDPRVRY
jgi:peptide/nickel transport system permease protein